MGDGAGVLMSFQATMITFDPPARPGVEQALVDQINNEDLHGYMPLTTSFTGTSLGHRWAGLPAVPATRYSVGKMPGL